MLIQVLYSINKEGDGNTGETGRRWWQFPETKMLVNMYITYRDEMRSQNQGPSANYRRQVAWEKILSK